MGSVTSEFPSEPTAPRDARRLLRGQLELWGAEDLTETAALLLSELASNVVRHAATGFEVSIEWSAPMLRVEVADGSSIIPAIKDLADENGGRGLQIVSALASEWGIEQRENGKAVWFTLLRGGSRAR